MSFSSSLTNEPSKVYAVTESETKALLLPATEMNAWIKQFPKLNNESTPKTHKTKKSSFGDIFTLFN